MPETQNVGTANFGPAQVDSFGVPVVPEEETLKAIKETANKKVPCLNSSPQGGKATGLSIFENSSLFLAANCEDS